MLHKISSYVYLLIYVLLWAVTCYKYYRNVKFTTGFIIIFSYLLYGILSFFLYNNEYYGGNYEELTLFPFIYLYAMLYVFLVPIFKYERNNVMYVSVPSRRIVNVFLVIYGISSLVVLPNTLATLKEGLTVLFLDSYGGTELYKMAQENHIARVSGVAGIYGFFAIIHNIFCDVALFIMAYYLTVKGKNRYLLLLLSIVVIADLLHPISSGGRTDVVMKSFAIIMALSIFYPFYTEQLKQSIKKVIIVISLIIAIPFMAMTISRFNEREGGTGGSILNYVAQAPLNFNVNALDNGGIRNGDRTINLFKELAGMNPPNTIGAVRLKYSQLKMDDSIFSTYVGDFVLDFGPLGAFIIFLLFTCICAINIRIRHKTIPFHSLSLLYFISCVAMQGGMYLFYYSFTYNLNIVAALFIYILFYIDHRSYRNYLVRET